MVWRNYVTVTLCIVEAGAPLLGGIRRCHAFIAAAGVSPRRPRVPGTGRARVGIGPTACTHDDLGRMYLTAPRAYALPPAASWKASKRRRGGVGRRFNRSIIDCQRAAELPPATTSPRLSRDACSRIISCLITLWLPVADHFTPANARVTLHRRCSLQLQNIAAFYGRPM